MSSIVVGVDESSGAADALRLAAREGRLRGWPSTAVMCWGYALLEAAKGGDLIVVGTRGLGGFKGLFLGSVSTQVTHHAPCPVVVIPKEVEP